MRSSFPFIVQVFDTNPVHFSLWVHVARVLGKVTAHDACDIYDHVVYLLLLPPAVVS